MNVTALVNLFSRKSLLWRDYDLSIKLAASEQVGQKMFVFEIFTLQVLLCYLFLLIYITYYKWSDCLGAVDITLATVAKVAKKGGLIDTSKKDEISQTFC